MKTFTTVASLCLLGLLFFVVSDARLRRTTARPGTRTARPARPPRLSNTDRLATASSRFAVDLFMTLHPDLSSNTVLSPHSAHTALAMTMMGAKRDTENEMMNALGLRQAGLPKNRVHAAYKTLLTSLSNINGRVNLTNANGVFVKAGAHLHNSFRRGLQQSYNAKVEKFDMTHPDGPAAPINAWVSNATRGKITDLLAASDVTPSTFMILINAIYMNATWRHRFTESMTSDQPFNSVSSGVQQIPTMTMTKNLK
ncbi:serpin B6-like isoform X2 [Physella acuta]|uniref:serpin B6-like isoform X2 n=1 Tax=Physella acuta TaxID=109671 RepID=UPI0027DBFCBC|nr:serpin B6-like isoform X2 [Physella acuta]